MTDAPLTSHDLDQIGACGLATLYPDRLKILIGSASCGIAAGAREVEAAALEASKKLGLGATITRTGCIGFCQREPLVDLFLPDGPRVSFARMNPKKVSALLESYAEDKLSTQHALCRFAGEVHVETEAHHWYRAPTNGLSLIDEWAWLNFNRRQERVILRNCGSIDPLWVEEGGRAGLLAPALAEYRRALEICAAPGVVQDALRDLELIRAAGMAGLEPAFELLEGAIAGVVREGE